MKLSKNLTTNALTNDVENAVRSSYALNAVPRLRADWNLNRYSLPTADNIPAEVTDGFDVEAFPIESIIETIRPTKGIVKALVGQATVAGKYLNSHDVRFYVGSRLDKYKYWTSPVPTDANGDFPLHTDGITVVRPHVLYPSVLKANKIVIKVENTWATPDTWSVLGRSTTGAVTAGAWNTLATTPTIAADGTVTLFFNGSTWSTTRPATLVTANIGGLMLRVESMKGGIKRDGNPTTYTKRVGTPGSLVEHVTDGSLSNFNLIAIEPHLEVDLTGRLMDVSDDFDMSETSQLYPIGTITSNTANLTLSNDDGIFNNENTESPYYQLLEPNVEFNLEYIYTISGVSHSVQQFKMYGAGWPGQSSALVTVELEDASKYLKEMTPNPTLFQNKTVTEIIWRILDSVGFVDYEIGNEDLVVEHVLEQFWCDGEKTAWELLDELAKASQTAIYFDANGKLQVRTREAAFRDTALPDWTLRGQTEGSELADISELEVEETYEANNIDVVYTASKWKVGTTGKPALTKVWEPESDNVVVRACPLVQPIVSTSTNIKISSANAKIWPYKSLVNIEGEVIRYEGKEFVYYTYTESVNSAGITVYTSPVKHTIFVNDFAEYTKYNETTPLDYRSKNFFTGNLKIKARGEWNSPVTNHNIDITGWSTKMDIVHTDPDVYVTGKAGFYHNKKQSTVTINTPPRMTNAADTFWAQRGAVTSTPYKMYGTKFKFNPDKASTTQRGGIAVFLNGARNDGYYVEFCLTNSLSGRERKLRNEVMIYSKKGNSYIKLDKGAATAIARKRYYEVDVYVTNGTQDTITVWVNGRRVASATTTSATVQTATGKMALYARGKTNMTFEYIYGLTHVPKEPADDFGFYDLKYGGVRGGFWTREALYQLKTGWRWVTKKKRVRTTYRLNDYLFDEFGPYVHEIREFDVKFDPKPVQYAALMSTNEWATAPVGFRSNPFGAEFIIANTSRHNAVVHGEDNLVFAGSGQAVQQVLTVLGRNLEIAEDEKINKKNPAAIRARGQIDVELSSEWIQSKAMAEAVAEWMVKHWSEGLDSAKAVIFGNPLIEIGDVVSIDYNFMHMAPETHKYFVVGTSTNFNNGLETTLRLRRVRTAPDEAIS